MKVGLDNLSDILVNFSQSVVNIVKGDEKEKPVLEQKASIFIDASNKIPTIAQEIQEAKIEYDHRIQEELRIEEERKKLEKIEKEKMLAQAIPIGIKEVFLAAKEIESESQKYVQDDTSAGRVVEKATGIGLILQELASLAKIGNPRDIINKTKEIAALVDSISSFINEICATCPDQALNRELKDFGQVTKNFAIQMKILAAVKASRILEDDQEGINSLIICSQGLAKNVNEIMKLSHIAKLKTQKRKNT